MREYLPGFRLHDPVAAAQATARDLVTHRTGLPRHDLLWLDSSLSRRQMYERLRYLEPSKPFRSAFQYNNLMFMTAGILAETLGGASWEDLVRKRLLEPLEMTRANFSVRDSLQSEDYAHTYGVDRAGEIPLRNIDAIGPAGSINSTLEEMTRYLLLHLNSGNSGGKQILPAIHFERMRTPQVVTPPGGIGPELLGQSFYGMGLVVSTYRGHPLVWHTGTIGGYHALLTFLPAERAGVMILQNRVVRAIPQILSWRIYDLLLGLTPVAWNKPFQDEESKRRQEEAKARKEAESKRKAGANPSHPLADYAARYQHPAYGTVTVAVEGDRLRWKLNGQEARELKHFHYDIFEAEGQKVSFLGNLDGEIDQVAVRLEPAVREIVFTRVPVPK
ncbi:MAG: serine hydrolase [Candidatus Solibacter usitatus]|nr:serine hydrolase [Candidatus Solibacter usitatus]